MPAPNFAKGCTQAAAAYRMASSKKVPRGVLTQVADIWRNKHRDVAYGDTWKAMDPLSHYNQQVGLLISTSISDLGPSVEGTQQE